MMVHRASPYQNADAGSSEFQSPFQAPSSLDLVSILLPHFLCPILLQPALLEFFIFNLKLSIFS